MPSSPANARSSSRWSSRTATWCGSTSGGASDRRRGAGRPPRQRRQEPPAARRRGAEAAPAAQLRRQRRRHLGRSIVSGRLAGAAADQPDRPGRGGAAEPAAPALRDAPSSARSRTAGGAAARRRGGARGGPPRVCAASLNERFGKRPLIEIQLVRISSSRCVSVQADDRPAQPCRDRRAGSRRRERDLSPGRSAPGSRRRARCRRMASRSCSSNCRTPRSSCSSRSAPTSPVQRLSRAQSGGRHAPYLLRGRRHHRRARPAARRGRERARRRRAEARRPRQAGAVSAPEGFLRHP